MGLLKALWKEPRSRFGLILFALMALIGLCAPILTSHSPTDMGFMPWEKPSAAHPMGTTGLGQDVYTQFLYATRLSLTLALVTGLLVALISTAIGLTAAFYGGLADELISFFTNVVLVLPALPLIIVIAAYIKVGGFWPVVLVVALTGWAWGARVLRAQALTLRERDFVHAAIASGETPARVILTHLIPNMSGLIAANFFGAAVYAILTATGLEFLGLGDVSLISWGTMLYWAGSEQAMLHDAWVRIAAPGLGIALLGTAFALLNFGIDSISNPRLRLQAPVHKKPRPVSPDALRAQKNLVSAQNVTVQYDTPKGAVTAVSKGNLDVKAGEFIGLAGESGCGKSTLAFAMTRLLRSPGFVAEGAVYLENKNLLDLDDEELRKVRWKDFSLVFQASMNVLNPVLTVRDQIYDALQAHGMRDKAELEKRALELFGIINIRPQFLDSYPHQLSGGMRQRVVIAIALALQPKVIVMDEPTTALDVVVQRSLLQEIADLRKKMDISIIFITHDLSLLVEMSDRIVIMYAGQIVEEAKASDIYARPRHPYTKLLMSTFPPISGPKERRHGIPGRPPVLTATSRGCPFADRCPSVIPGVCTSTNPMLLEIEKGHKVACHLEVPEMREVKA
ncbi:dipeptide/oligopeptide/nickel ABC transporter permease/ATP-binding protein [Deinococcus cellulosilyticus]|uniref:Peptide ABC transporter ATP-binding protein n=1 Tax=Deinococcus cellulosilyticus (strain DSM 18568 / NBRC 106333 / KACC 11606 / 5516J-15) TaxID=1223518 RepID=A0A511N859_DEIC1|nr:dipeptide/oligopeptide/nickel ABC transporter permease/ATP-binding protein [Deinococcus cellulosilyticus]GEM49023.1 peptide ABC transporter ATP-binding protein [Deinococcus cellulosilyticus NBRC 106333 = KACC 11606]